MADYPLRIFSGSAHRELAIEVSSILGTRLGKSSTRHFPDGEIHVMIDEVVRDHNIFFVQPCSSPVNDNLMELILFLDAFRRASAHEITVVLPYFPYARQDRMSKGREAISARVVANLLEAQGASRVIFMDIHNPAIQGFFNIPVDTLTAVPILSAYFNKPEFSNAAIVSPDVGRASLAAKYAENLHLPLVIMHKRRSDLQDVKITHIVGDIKGRQPIIIDDIISGGSVLTQTTALYNAGAVGKAYFAITHPVLQSSALEILSSDDRIGKLVVTNTIPLPSSKVHPKIEVLSVAPVLAEIISRVHHGDSISDMLVKT
jgi:ribose-phosphate pyrophosphokinase